MSMLPAHDVAQLSRIQSLIERTAGRRYEQSIMLTYRRADSSRQQQIRPFAKNTAV